MTKDKDKNSDGEGWDLSGIFFFFPLHMHKKTPPVILNSIKNSANCCTLWCQINQFNYIGGVTLKTCLSIESNPIKPYKWGKFRWERELNLRDVTQCRRDLSFVFFFPLSNDLHACHFFGDLGEFRINHGKRGKWWKGYNKWEDEKMKKTKWKTWTFLTQQIFLSWNLPAPTARQSFVGKKKKTQQLKTTHLEP